MVFIIYGVKIILKIQLENGFLRGVPWNPPLCTNGSAGYFVLFLFFVFFFLFFFFCFLFVCLFVFLFLFYVITIEQKVQLFMKFSF